MPAVIGSPALERTSKTLSPAINQPLIHQHQARCSPGVPWCSLAASWFVTWFWAFFITNSNWMCLNKDGILQSDLLSALQRREGMGLCTSVCWQWFHLGTLISRGLCLAWASMFLPWGHCLLLSSHVLFRPVLLEMEQSQCSTILVGSWVPDCQDKWGLLHISSEWDLAGCFSVRKQQYSD